MSINISVVFISELVGCMQLTRYGVFLIMRKGFARLSERICKTLGEDSQDFERGFTRLWESIHETLGEHLQGFTRLWERICGDLQDFRRFARLWERIHKTLGEDLQDFGRGFARIWERICETG